MGVGASIIAINNIPITIHDVKINASTIPFPTKGVKLSYINEFYNLIGGKENIIELTTTEINDIYQKKITEEYKLSFCDYLSYINHPAVGEATVFISHAWKYKFVDVMDALEHYFKDQPDVIIWFDLFSNNQHITLDLDFDWWCGTFKSAIQKFGCTVMVLCPWNNPIPLTRAWCIWELYCTFISKSTLGIALSSTNQIAFLNDILDRGVIKEINKMLAMINAENSECYKPEDQQNIFEIVRKEVGFHKINSMIFEQMRDWVITTTKLFMNNETNEIKKLAIINALASLYYSQGKYNLAEPLYIDCLKNRKEILGDNHPNTLQSMHNLASLYQNKKKYNLSELLYYDCMKRRQDILGNSHPDTISSMNNLAVLFKNQEKYDQAEVLYLECLEGISKILGENHPDTIQILNNLGNLYKNQEKYDKAESIYLNCFRIRSDILGDNHPDTLLSMNNLASLYNNQEKYDKAEPLYMDCFHKRKEILGDNHPDTLLSMNNLASLYENQEKYDLAEALLVDCLKKRKEILGDNHPDTLISINNLAMLYDKQGKYDMVEPIY